MKKEEPLGHDCEGTPIFKGDICAVVDPSILDLTGEGFEPGAFLLAKGGYGINKDIGLWIGMWGGEFKDGWCCCYFKVLRLGKPMHEII